MAMEAADEFPENLRGDDQDEESEEEGSLDEIADESVWPAGWPPRWPAPVTRLFHLVNDVIVGTSNLHREWEVLQKYRKQHRGVVPQKVLERYRPLPSSIQSYPELAQFKRDRRDKAPARERELLGWFDRVDTVAFNGRKLVSAIDAARPAVAHVHPFVDNKDAPQIDWWTSRLRGHLSKLGSACRWQAGVPDIDQGVRPVLAEAYRGIVECFNQLKTLPPVPEESAEHQEIAWDHAAETQLPQSPRISGKSRGRTASWAQVLQTFGRQFETDRGRYPDLHHGLILTAEEDRDRRRGPPRVDRDAGGIWLQYKGSRYPVSMIQQGICGQQIIHAPTRPGERMRVDRPPIYDGHFFSCEHAEQSSLTGRDAFLRLAEGAWQCLPEEVTRQFRAEPNIVPAAATDAAASWMLLLYVLAWQTEGTAGWSADRSLYLPLNQPWIGGSGRWVQIGVENDCSPRRAPANMLEALIPRPRPMEELISAFPEIDASEFERVGIPPRSFAAFLEPDVFLCSKLAIDWLVSQLGPPPESATPAETQGREPVHPSAKIDGWTKEELCQEAEISGPTFNRIRRSTEGVPNPGHGAHGFRFSRAHLRLMIATAMASSGPAQRQAAERWEEYLVAAEQ